jgi:CotS family spore coat protein
LNSNLEEMSRHNKELKRIYGYIRKKTGKTEFEYDILEHFEEFYELAGEAERRCLSSGYEEANALAVRNTDICHGNYSYHNLLHMEKGAAVINFEHSGSGLLIRDFAFFLRKVMEKHDWNQEFGEELIEAYDTIRTISAVEKETLEILLTYPEKFWKILNHYYNRNKAYLPDQMRDKIHKVYQQQKNKTMFIKAILN